jgi:hypothetical protein
MKVVVAQKGAREHFAVARALHQRGMLAELATDWYAPGQGWLRWIGSRIGAGKVQAALAARAEGVPDDLVRVRWKQGLAGKWIEQNRWSRGSASERNLAADIAFTTDLASLQFPPHEVFFGYSYASLEMLEVERKRGVLTVLDQIDPGPAEFRMVAEEMRRQPELAGMPAQFPAKNFERLRGEWAAADVIVVNSEWSREGITSTGADPAKIELLPLAYELRGVPGRRRRESGGRIRRA